MHADAVMEPSNNLPGLVDPLGHSQGCIGNINPGEDPFAQQIAMRPGAVRVVSDDLGVIIDAKGMGTAGTRNIDLCERAGGDRLSR